MKNVIEFNIDSAYIQQDIAQTLFKNFGKDFPIIICLGSDKILSDCVGVFVAEILKKKKIDTFVFGGTERPVLSSQIDFIKKMFTGKKILFVDSGVSSKNNVVTISQKISFLSGKSYSGMSIIASTIGLENKRYILANARLQEIVKFANIIANAICEFFSYVNIIKI